MKRTRSPARRPASKRTTPMTVDGYFMRVPEPARSRLTQLRAAIRRVMPHTATEVISYRMPAFEYDGVLVWYAAFANHFSLFPGGSVLEGFKRELTDFKTSKGTVQFPLDKPLPIQLITRIVRARVAELEAKKRR